VVLSISYVRDDLDGTHQDIGSKLVGLLLEGSILLQNYSPDVSSSLSNTLQIRSGTVSINTVTYINESSGKVLALLGELLELLQESVGDIGGRLYDGRSSST
jgi:hypothetical protein